MCVFKLQDTGEGMELHSELVGCFFQHAQTKPWLWSLAQHETRHHKTMPVIQEAEVEGSEVQGHHSIFMWEAVEEGRRKEKKRNRWGAVFSCLYRCVRNHTHTCIYTRTLVLGFCPGSSYMLSSALKDTSRVAICISSWKNLLNLFNYSVSNTVYLLICIESFNFVNNYS